MGQQAGRAVWAALLSAVVVSSSGCFSERRSPTGLDDIECSVTLPTPGANEVLVATRDFAFHPAEVRVPAGTTVTWINCEPAGSDHHTATADDGTWGSPSLPPVGGTYSRTFGLAGRFDYHCVPHPFMRGIVVVEG